ncbi:hypothetical protein BJY52DRAFT_1359482 [Lactarius psammicola]|nr:hypothetical protein BJY52DRAFT_1359482 [Lactarius psammicola]
MNIMDSLLVGHNVTAVGGTAHIPEIAAGFLGGGFSNYFQRPKWQDVVVTNYLASLPNGTYEGLFNPSGRIWAIPDVSVQALNFRISFQGKAVKIGGTSAATPTFSADVNAYDGPEDALASNIVSTLSRWRGQDINYWKASSNYRVVQLLVQHGANVNAQDRNHSTPLHLAS